MPSSGAGRKKGTPLAPVPSATNTVEASAPTGTTEPGVGASFLAEENHGRRKSTDKPPRHLEISLGNRGNRATENVRLTVSESVGNV